MIRIEITGALQGLCEIALSAPMSAHFAALLTGETAEPAAEISSDTREAAAELIQQICGNAADRLRRAFGPLGTQTSSRRSAIRRAAHASSFSSPRESDALEFELHILRLAPRRSSQPQPIDDAIAKLSPQPIAQPVRSDR